METLTTIPAAQTDFEAAHWYLAKLKSSVGAAGMRSALGLAARTMGAADLTGINWASLNAANIEALIARIANTTTERGARRSPNSVSTVLSAIKGAAKACWQRGTMTTDTWERIRDVKAPKGARLPAGRDMSYRELAMLVQVCIDDKSPAGYRDAAALAMLMATGMRRAELAALTFADINLETGEIRIMGKGDKERMNDLQADALEALNDWLAVRGRAGECIFTPIGKGGRIEISRPMTPTALHLMLQKRAAEAGLEGVTLHNFRRTLAGNLMDEGVDISTVAAWLGHADVKTTQRYDRRGERARKAAATKIRIPYRRG